MLVHEDCIDLLELVNYYIEDVGLFALYAYPCSYSFLLCQYS